MSYDIKFKARVENSNIWVDLPIYPDDLNITWNVRKIITESTGLEWKNEEDNGLVKDVIPKIKKGLKELKFNSEKYKQFEPENGFGNVDGVINFFNDIISAWERFASDYDTSPLENYAHFWIM